MIEKRKKVLFLVPPNFSGGLESLLQKYLKQAGLSDENILIKCLTQGCLYKRTKTKYSWKQELYPQFENNVKTINPDIIVCNDKAALGFLTQKYISLALTRGSIYKWNDIPVLVINEIRNVKSTTTGRWILMQDLGKLKRWLNGNHRHQPKFSYTVCNSRDDLLKLYNAAQASILISEDIETSGKGTRVIITCCGFTCWQSNGTVHTWVVPFVDTTVSDGCYWRNPDDEIFAFETIKSVHKTPAPKVMQNGSYDSTHFMAYNLPLHNYTLDTLHLFHSIWPEAPKRLDFISSICLDFYRFWKDEGKEDAKDDEQKTRVPQTAEGLRDYWRYNALDCYYTLMDTIYLTLIYSQPQMKWAKDNYIREFRLQTGPALAGSMRGCKLNTEIQKQFDIDLTAESAAARKDLELMVGDPNFNPNSTKQMPQLIYDILHANQIPRQGRTCGETVLKLVATEHPLYNRIIEQIWATKKPANNASKYGQMPLLNGRFMYKISAAATVTWRFSTKASDFWYGKNVQNVPEPMRVMFEPDEDYVLFDFDYSQSDSYFTAFESEDPKYMSTMTDERDVHCVHAEHFFKKGYEILLKAKKNHEEWCTHKVTGVRSVTKRVVYGANYLMSAYTLFLTMGREAVIAAAKHLGYDDAGSWNYKQYILLCQKFLDAYFEMYPMLHPWLQEEIIKATGNANLVTCFGGNTRLFFADLDKDKASQRELAAFFGQGGTAGNINAFLDDFYYRDNKFSQIADWEDLQDLKIYDSSDIMFLFQVHDSVVGQVRKDKLHLLEQLKTQMERTCAIHGRTFVVPVEGQVGLGWGKRMIDWHPDIILDEIESADKEWWIKWLKKKKSKTG